MAEYGTGILVLVIYVLPGDLVTWWQFCTVVWAVSEELKMI